MCESPAGVVVYYTVWVARGVTVFRSYATQFLFVSNFSGGDGFRSLLVDEQTKRYVANKRNFVKEVLFRRWSLFLGVDRHLL